MAKGGRKRNDQAREGRQRCDAETILGIIRERGSKGLVWEDVYRQLSNVELSLTAYGKISRNQGAMTPGINPETAEGMSLEKVHTIMEAIRYER
jgi:hypothetical protein